MDKSQDFQVLYINYLRLVSQKETLRLERFACRRITEESSWAQPLWVQIRGRGEKWEEEEVKQQSSVTKASTDATVNSGARVLAEGALQNVLIWGEKARAV